MQDREIRVKMPQIRCRNFAFLGLLALSVTWLWGCSQASYSECERGPDHRLDAFKNDSDARKLVGLRKEDVSKRLGTPTSRRFDGEWDISYWLRPRGLCMDGWYLVMSFNEDGTVADARVLPG